MDTRKMSLKLLVDNKGSRVLFAEAPKEFVDFIFSIFSISVGTLFTFDQMAGVGSLGKLKDSIQSFDQNYLQPGIKVDYIFNPKTPFNSNAFFLSNSSVDQSGTGTVSSQVYRCSITTSCKYQSAFGQNPFGASQFNSQNPFGASQFNGQNSFGGSQCKCSSYATLHMKSNCPCCGSIMNLPMTVVKPNTTVKTNEVDKNKSGYVKEVVTYMVMDDLVVKPMSTISSITLINKFGVKDLSQLEERTVSFGKEEGMKLLNASLTTDKVLTTIFMP